MKYPETNDEMDAMLTVLFDDDETLSYLLNRMAERCKTQSHAMGKDKNMRRWWYKMFIMLRTSWRECNLFEQGDEVKETT